MMPISAAAPKTGRDITKRLLLALLVASATLPAQPASAAAATPTPVNAPTMAPPPPTAGPMYVPGPSGVMGYYMMQGSTIVSGAFPSAPDCFKALAKLMKTLPVNTAPIVCAHRVP